MLKERLISLATVTDCSVWVLFFCFPIFMANINGAASSIFSILFLVALVSSKNRWKLLKDSEKKVIFGFVIFVLFAGTSILWADDTGTSFKKFEKVLRFLLLIPIYLLIVKKIHIIKSAFIWGNFVAAPCIAITAIYSQVSGRSEGAYNSILFGDFSLLICSCCLAISVLSDNKPKLYRFLFFISSLCALYAGILSQTRGALLLFPFTLIIICIFYIKQKQLVSRSRVLTAIISLFIAISIVLIVDSPLKQRIHYTIDEFSRIESGDFGGAIGTRLLNWKASVEHFKKSPLFGSGLGDHKSDTIELISKDSSYSPIKPYVGEAHSLYFEYLGTLGLCGLLLLLLVLFIVPFNTIRKTPILGNENIRLFQAIGVITIISGVIYGIGQNWLARNSFTTAYIFYLSISIAAVYHFKPPQKS